MNLHVLVPDLFLAAGAGPDPYRALALSALETMLARGEAARTAGGSLEAWLAATFAIDGVPEPPLAALSLIGEGVDPGESAWVRADPVHLEARGDHLLLADSASMAIEPEEAASLVAGLNAHFARDGIEFIAPHPGRWYARVRVEPRLRTMPASGAARRPLREVLPAGEDAPRWRSLMNEAQMLLHAHPCNELREARGTPTVNGVWFWGAGRARRPGRNAPYRAVWSSNPLAVGIADAAGLDAGPIPAGGAPEIVAAGAGALPHLLVLDALTGALAAGIERWREGLEAMETGWFAPLLAGLGAGQCETLTLHCLGPDGGRLVRLSRWTRRRWWRARRRLAHYAS